MIGTNHYNPGRTLPGVAEQLGQLGFRTTVVQSKDNPEKSAEGLPGLEALKTADVAVFFMRFLTLPDDQLRLVTDYLKSGKPVVGFRTSTHAFAYEKDDPRSKWNDDFGRDALGSKYFIHLQGKTKVTAADSAKEHSILAGTDFDGVTCGGTLYLSDLPSNAVVLLEGSGKSKKTGRVTNAFGTHDLQAEMTQPVAWTWTNKWGGRTFGTTLGHPATFEQKSFVKLCLNGICWAAGQEALAGKAQMGDKPGGKADKKKGSKSGSQKKKDCLLYTSPSPRDS